MSDKIIIYQVLPRLWGNDVETPVFNGSKEQNGCGTMNNFTLAALRKIKALGTTHVWYTGLIEHATQTDYSEWGIRRDHRAMVKGKAGSPYAIKDYYDIDPDLASKPQKRMAEFEALVERTHKAGLKMIIDFVPNHVARQYGSDANPGGGSDLGEGDNQNQAFSPQNNFYYIPGQQLACRFDMTDTEATPYREFPAKATGNDCFGANPERNDWYETVKLNYGVDYCGGRVGHFVPRPDTWDKMCSILLFWANKGVDAFRCDMAEMVPVEFWNWALKQVKQQYPDVIFIGEVYNPSLYRDYIYRGNFDYLYDKVGLYDTLKGIVRMECGAQCITPRWQELDDIRPHMLYFLENHDEQRLASPFFAGEAKKGIPALAVSALLGNNPFMLYFGQEFGEPGMEREGFSGEDGRTTIFDYWRVKTIQQWRSRGRYLLKNLPRESQELYAQYRKVLTLAVGEECFGPGKFYDLMYVNYENPNFDANRVYAFIRSTDRDACLVVCNFSDEDRAAGVNIPQHALEFLQIKAGRYRATDLMTAKKCDVSLSAEEQAIVKVTAWSVAILKFNK